MAPTPTPPAPAVAAAAPPDAAPLLPTDAGSVRRISASSGGEGLAEESSLIGDDTTTGEEVWTRESEVNKPAGLAGSAGGFGEGLWWAATEADKTSRTVCEEGTCAHFCPTLSLLLEHYITYTLPDLHGQISNK